MSAHDHGPLLLARLKDASRILELALSVMTTAQKKNLGGLVDNDIRDMCGLGVTRSDLRDAAITLAEGRS